MISYPLTIDGITYQDVHVTNIKRSFQVLDGDNAGRMMSGLMLRDIIGTFYNYSFTIDASAASRKTYDALYDAISSPQESHTVVVPYAQTTLRYQAYVTNGSDQLTDMGDENRWGNLTFNFIAMAPQRI